MAANRHGTNGLPFLLLPRAAPALHRRCTGAALYSIFKHMATPTRRRNSTWPLKTDILASKREGKLFNEDGSWWWLYISFCNSRHTALLQPALTFVLSLSHGTLRRLCVLTSYFGFSAFFWMACACVCAFTSWMLKTSHDVKKPAWLPESMGKCGEIQPSSSWPHCSWSSCCVWSPVKWCPLSALNVTSPAHLWNNWTLHRWNGKKWISGLVPTLFRWNSLQYAECWWQNGPVQVKMSSVVEPGWCCVLEHRFRTSD